MQIAVTFLASLLFGLGLIASGLANPAKVQNFLDIAGAWDPSLAFTMAAAILVTDWGMPSYSSEAVPSSPIPSSCRRRPKST